MHRKWSIVTALLCLLCVMSLAGPENARGVPGPVRAILEKFIQASGGPELDKVRTEKRRGTLVRGISGAVPYETAAISSGKWLYHQVFAYGEQVSYGCDGGRSWVQDAKGVSSLPPSERLALALLLDLRMPVKLGKFFPEMRIQGNEKIGTHEAVVITATTAAGDHWDLAFDRESGLLLRAGDLFFDDYREVGKVKRPFTVWLGTEKGPDSLRLKMVATSILNNIEVDDAAFTEPGCALPAGPPVLYTLRVEAPVSRQARQACVGVYQAADKADVFYTVTLQGEHLMIEQTGWGTSLEIMAGSETDYFMRFLNQEFHFIKDSAGRITGFEWGADRSKKAKKIK